MIEHHTRLNPESNLIGLPSRDKALTQFSRFITNARSTGANCGIGPGGFQPGNKCAKGGKSIKLSDSPDNKEWRQEWEAKNKKLKGPTKKVAERLASKVPGSVMIAVPDPDIDLIESKGQDFTTTGRKFKKGERNQCHTNTSKLYAKKQVDTIVTGYALSKDGGWRQHTWGLQKGKVVETTYDFLAYHGVRLTKAEAKDFAQAQGVKVK